MRSNWRYLAPSAYVSGAVEGIVDDAVMRRILQEVGVEVVTVYNTGGKTNLRQRLRGFNLAARHSDWVALADLDHDYPCAPEMVRQWLPQQSRGMRLRIAVREVEAWLLADRERIARYLSVPISRVPTNPDGETDPKATLVGLARRSARREIREGMVPRPGSGRPVGSEYTAFVIEFVQRWNIKIASGVSQSLNRTMQRLAEIEG